jgi:antitoxin HicB
MQTQVTPGQFAYAIRLERLDGEVIGRVLQWPEVLTGGADDAETLAALDDALEEAALARMANDKEIPLPDPSMGDGDGLAFLPPLTAARALVDIKRREQGLSKSALARQMGGDEKVVRRILDGAGTVKIDAVQDALRALGQRPTIAWGQVVARRLIETFSESPVRVRGIIETHPDGHVWVRRYSPEDRNLRRAHRDGHAVKLEENGFAKFFVVSKRNAAPGAARVEYVLDPRPAPDPAEQFAISPAKRVDRP